MLAEKPIKFLCDLLLLHLIVHVLSGSETHRAVRLSGNF